MQPCRVQSEPGVVALEERGRDGCDEQDLDQPGRDPLTFDHGQVQVVKIGEFTISRYTFEPGWRWTKSVKPIAETDSCQVHHVGYILSGRLRVATEDGGDAEIGPGEAYEIHPGHDGWVVGDEAVVSVEFSGPGS
jgi:hypothetical protein